MLAAWNDLLKWLNGKILMFPAARLTGLGWDRLNMHGFLCLANTPVSKLLSGWTGHGPLLIY